MYFPLWGLTALIFFFLKSNCHTWDFISASLVQCPLGVSGGQGRPGCTAPGGAGQRGGAWTARPLWFCAVLGKPIRWSHWFPPKRQMELPIRELRKLFTLGLQLFCLLTLVLFIVHDYGQLGCHFFADSSVTWGIGFWRWAYILLSLST